jgi:AraC-like DNA-binding protein
MLVSKVIVNKQYKEINPKVCGWEKCAPGHFYGPAVRSYWLLHFVVSGKGAFRNSRGEYSLGKNDVFIIRPYEVTYYEADGSEPWEYIWIGFASTLDMPAKLSENDVLYAPFLSELFHEAVNAEDVSSGGKGFEAFLCSRIWELLSRLEGSDGHTSPLADEYVRTAVNMMENEFHSGISVEAIADRLHLNRSHFSVTFKRVTGRSPREYLISLRMKKAAEWLCEEGLSVSVTAASVGYPDVFAFSRAFKNYYGVSPTEYTKTNID